MYVRACVCVYIYLYVCVYTYRHVPSSEILLGPAAFLSRNVDTKNKDALVLNKNTINQKSERKSHSHQGRYDWHQPTPTNYLITLILH